MEQLPENAPIDREELSRYIGGFSCYEEEFCRKPNQRVDVHHFLYPKNLISKLGLTKERQKRENQVNCCRCKHELIHKMWEFSQLPEGAHEVQQKRRKTNT